MTNPYSWAEDFMASDIMTSEGLDVVAYILSDVDNRKAVVSFINENEKKEELKNHLWFTVVMCMAAEKNLKLRKNLI